jgi:hypothetical protein
MIGAAAAPTRRSKHPFVNSGPSGALFAADWPNRVGAVDETDASLSQGTPFNWDHVLSNDGTPAPMALVAATGRGFPAGIANIVRCQASLNNVFLQLFAGHWPTPAVGTTIYYRLYYRCEYTDSAGFDGSATNHPVQADDNGTWNWHVGNNTDGTFWLFMHWDSVLQNWRINGPSGTLQKNRTYRIEWSVTRVTATTNSMAIRVYDADDVTLLFPNLGNTLFVGDNGGGSLEAWGAGFNGGRTNPGTGIDSLQQMELGCNGGPGYANQPQYQFYGGVMIRNDTWCGAY